MFLDFNISFESQDQPDSNTIINFGRTFLFIVSVKYLVAQEFENLLANYSRTKGHWGSIWVSSYLNLSDVVTESFQI